MKAKCLLFLPVLKAAASVAFDKEGPGLGPVTDSDSFLPLLLAPFHHIHFKSNFCS